MTDEKRFLDFEGLEQYDALLKKFIQGESDNLKELLQNYIDGENEWQPLGKKEEKE